MLCVLHSCATVTATTENCVCSSLSCSHSLAAWGTWSKSSCHTRFSAFSSLAAEVSWVTARNWLFSVGSSSQGQIQIWVITESEITYRLTHWGKRLYQFNTDVHHRKLTGVSNTRRLVATVTVFRSKCNCRIPYGCVAHVTRVYLQRQSRWSILTGRLETHWKYGGWWRTNRCKSDYSVFAEE